MALLDRCQVGERELGLDDLDVGDRVDLAVDVDHVLVLEAAHHVARSRRSRGCWRGTGCPGPRPCDAPATRPAMSTNSTIAGMIFCGLTMSASCVEPRVRHLDDADVRLDGAERIVRRRDAGLGQRVEQGGLADVGQADDAALQADPWFEFDSAALRTSAVARLAASSGSLIPRPLRGGFCFLRRLRSQLGSAMQLLHRRLQSPATTSGRRRCARSIACVDAALSSRDGRSSTKSTTCVACRADARCRSAAARSRACPGAAVMSLQAVVPAIRRPA